MISLPPLRVAVALLYVLGMLSATLGSGGVWLGLRFPSELLDLGHVPLFAGLCLVLLWAVRAPFAPRVWSVAIFCLLFAGADEAAQRFTPDRVSDWTDFAANVVGVGIGLIIGIACIKGAQGVPILPRGGSTR